VIHRFVENIEKIIVSNPIVLSSNIQKHFGPTNDTVYVKGSIIFIGSSILDIAIFANKTSTVVSIEKYRFQYMDKQGQMLFRYDNAPHYPELFSFPGHKHVGDRTISSPQSDLKDIFNEITALILKK
jgi:hypothetical protein